MEVTIYSLSNWNFKKTYRVVSQGKVGYMYNIDNGKTWVFLVHLTYVGFVFNLGYVL